MQGFTIGQLARAAGVPVSTLRYYERTGLLKPQARTGGNYRCYDAGALERLRFIRAAQATGFQLHDVAEMLELATSSDPPCSEVTSLLQHRLADVRSRLKELRRMEKALSGALATCCSGGPDWCEQIQRLKGPTAGPCKASAKCCTQA